MTKNTRAWIHRNSSNVPNDDCLLIIVTKFKEISFVQNIKAIKSVENYLRKLHPRENTSHCIKALSKCLGYKVDDTVIQNKAFECKIGQNCNF